MSPITLPITKSLLPPLPSTHPAPSPIIDALKPTTAAPFAPPPTPIATPRHPSITPTEASVPCQTLGITALLTKLNALTSRTFTLDAPGVQSTLDWCLSEGLDFGGAYGRLRHLWATPNIATARAAVAAEEQATTDLRASAFFIDAQGRRTLKHPYIIGPRRLWDLPSHRVVPASFIPDRHHLWAVTHAWREIMVGAWSPVNERQWKVPLPETVTLEAIRDELLGMGAVYCWLDVACNRQRSDVKGEDGQWLVEPLLDKELEVDLPTMGNIYGMAAKVVRYYSGLGLPFTPTGLTDTRHWFMRGWTLQEMNISTAVGGLYTETRAVPVTGFERDRDAEEFPEVAALLRPLEAIVTATPRLAKVVKAMRPRYTRDAVDKIYGLGYMIKARTLPAYKADKTNGTSYLEDVWWQLVHCMSDTMRGELLFLFTQPGKFKKRKWLPKWEQLMTADMVQDSHLDESVTVLASGKAKYYGYLMADCRITGDEVTVTGHWEVDRKFVFRRDETCALEGSYTLVGNPRREYFVVCKPQLKPKDVLEKVFVIRLAPAETERLLEWGLSRTDCIFK